MLQLHCPFMYYYTVCVYANALITEIRRFIFYENSNNSHKFSYNLNLQSFNNVFNAFKYYRNENDIEFVIIFDISSHYKTYYNRMKLLNLLY